MLTHELVAAFLAQGGEIKVLKPARAPRRNWFRAAKGRATAYAHNRRDNTKLREREHNRDDSIL